MNNGLIILSKAYGTLYWLKHNKNSQATRHRSSRSRRRVQYDPIYVAIAYTFNKFLSEKDQ